MPGSPKLPPIVGKVKLHQTDAFKAEKKQLKKKEFTPFEKGMMHTIPVTTAELPEVNVCKRGLRAICEAVSLYGFDDPLCKGIIRVWIKRDLVGDEIRVLKKKLKEEFPLEDFDYQPSRSASRKLKSTTFDDAVMFVRNPLVTEERATSPFLPPIVGVEREIQTSPAPVLVTEERGNSPFLPPIVGVAREIQTSPVPAPVPVVLEKIVEKIVDREVIKEVPIDRIVERIVDRVVEVEKVVEKVVNKVVVLPPIVKATVTIETQTKPLVAPKPKITPDIAKKLAPATLPPITPTIVKQEVTYYGEAGKSIQVEVAYGRGRAHRRTNKHIIFNINFDKDGKVLCQVVDEKSSIDKK